MPKYIHIGKKIKEILVKSRIGKKEFADMINVSRTVVYDIYKRETIDTALLQKISTALNHDFFGYYKNVDLASVNDDGNKEYGYATKAELHHLEETILKEFQKLRDEIVAKPPPSAKKKRSTKK